MAKLECEHKDEIRSGGDLITCFSFASGTILELIYGSYHIDLRPLFLKTVLTDIYVLLYLLLECLHNIHLLFRK